MITVVKIILELSLAGSGRRIGDGGADQTVGRIIGAGIGQVVDRIDDLCDRAGIVRYTLIHGIAVQLLFADIAVFIVGIGDIAIIKDNQCFNS